MWLTLGYEHLSTHRSLFWEQKNHSEQNQLNCPKDMARMSLELYSHSIIIKIVTGLALTVATTHVFIERAIMGLSGWWH